MMQLDIFEHSRDVMLRNDVLLALQQRDCEGSRAAWKALEQEYPSDDALGPLSVLVDAVDRTTDAPFANQQAMHDAVRMLADVVEPAARRMFGDSGGEDWMRPLWRLAAQRGTALPFRAPHADDHAAVLWLLACDWPKAVQAVEGIESWHRIPAPLGWMVQARYRMEGLDVVWPLLVELAWLAPARFHAVTQWLADPLLDKLRKQFDAEFEGEGDERDLAWFPAWLLTQKSGLSRTLSAARPCVNDKPERAMRLLVDLIGLEHEGRQHEIVDRRRRLRSTHEPLYEAYMRLR
ncbi:MAG TPA: hypothetical protein VFP68_09960 [Burkholderiaceae bacterium]|nr:hypothetical protein [Burkholderiaceae bacterium]